MDRFKNFNVESLQKELKPAALRERAKELNDRYSSPSSASSSRGPPPVRTKPAVRALPPTSTSTSEASASYQPAASAPFQNESGARPAPPPRRAPAGHHADSSTTSNGAVDWRNLTRADKDALFRGFDALLSRGSPAGTAFRADSSADIVQPPAAPPSSSPPPSWAPPLPATPKSLTSYPPPSRGSSHAFDAASYFHPSTRWDSKWFADTENPTPPHLQGRQDIACTASWQQMGTNKTLTGAALFSDLSIAWWRVEWDLLRERSPDFPNTVRRQAKYLDRPAVLETETLWEACSTYGEQVAQFAEQAEQNGVPVTNGECWDLANQALASVSGLPPPVPSISRTHGHLIFSGISKGRAMTDQKGLWRGGDTAIRRGDIVEWRKVRVRRMDGSGWSDLGNPDHTAVIVQSYLSSDPEANTQPTDGQEIAPWSVGILEVIEQSQGKVPSRAVYDLAGMESGEIWIYRPVSMEGYVGIGELKADWNQYTTRGVVQTI